MAPDLTGNATFIVYIFLSCFDTITERERDVVRFALDLVSCYDVLTGELPATHNISLLAMIYAAELRIIAAGLGYVPGTQDSTILSAVFLPLIRDITGNEYNRIIGSMREAETLLSRPLGELNKLVATWKFYRHQTTLRSQEELEPPSLMHPPVYSESPKRMPRSECSKELELLASSTPKDSKRRFKPKPLRAFLPHVTTRGRVRTFDADRTLEYDSPTSDKPYPPIDDMFEKDLQELVENGPDVECLCHTGHLCFIHAEGHPCDYETRSKTPSRKFGRRLHSGFKALLSSF